MNWMKNYVDKRSVYNDFAKKIGATCYQIEGRKDKILLLEDGKEKLEFMSCSYLGLDQDDRLLEAARRSIDQYSNHYSSSIKRVRIKEYDLLQENISKMMGMPSLISTSVSNVHIGVLPCLLSGSLPNFPISDEGSVVLIDKTCHMSMQILRGIYEQFGDVRRFEANELDKFEELIKDYYPKTPIVLLDGIGSMGGVYNLNKISEILSEYSGYLYVDDAHGISTYGRNGCGYARQELGILKNTIYVGSLAKGFGIPGGGFASIQYQEDIETISKSSTSLNFGGPLSISSIASGLVSSKIHLSNEIYDLQNKLWSNTDLFDQLYIGDAINSKIQSPIRGIKDTEETVLNLSKYLMFQDVAITPVFYPTIEKGKGMIRIAVSALHKPEDIKKITKSLNDFLGESK